MASALNTLTRPFIPFHFLRHTRNAGFGSFVGLVGFEVCLFKRLPFCFTGEVRGVLSYAHRGLSEHSAFELELHAAHLYIGAK